MSVSVTMRRESVAVKTDDLATHEGICDQLEAIAQNSPVICTASRITADLWPGKPQPEWYMVALACSAYRGMLEAKGLQPAMLVSRPVEGLRNEGWYATVMGYHEGEAVKWDLVK